MEYEFNVKNPLGALIAGFTIFADATVFAQNAAPQRGMTLRVFDRKGNELVRYNANGTIAAFS